MSITKYAFSDEGAKAKLYIDVDRSLLQSSATQTSRVMSVAGCWVEFSELSVDFQLVSPVRNPFWAPDTDAVIKHVLKLDLLHAVSACFA